MHALYSVVLVVGFVLGLPWFLWKGRASGKYLRTFRERMGQLIELAQWLPFHETAQQTENVILWVRGDLFPDTKPSTTP